MNQRVAALALAKTIEYLANENLILEDSLALSYDFDNVEKVIISFNCIRGFAETFKNEYNRLREYDPDVKKTENGVQVTTDWLE